MVKTARAPRLGSGLTGWGGQSRLPAVAGASRGAAACAAVLCVALWAACAWPSQALCAQSAFRQGVAGLPFKLTAPIDDDIVWNTGNDQSLSLAVRELQVLDSGSKGYAALGVLAPDPTGVDLAGDDVLVADAANRLVAEFDSSGKLVWSYSASSDSSLRSPVCARRLDDGDTLIVDKAANRVFVVDELGSLQWQYGVTGERGDDVNRLDAPASAEVLDNGNVVICDAGNHRVIVVRASDYDAAAANAGFTKNSIVWQYGTTGVSGDGVDHLKTPASAQQLTAGSSQSNVLICDAGAGRVIEVRARDYDASASRHGFTTESIVWRFPAAGSSATLSAPSGAVGSHGSDNIVWIADAGGGRVLGVLTGSAPKEGSRSASPTRHDVFADYGASDGTPLDGSLSAPVALAEASDGGLAIADPGARRVVLIGATAESATVQSKRLDCGLTGRKRFASATCVFTPVPNAPIAITYRIDSGQWKLLGTFSGLSSPGTTETIPFPKLTVGTTITYLVTLKSGLSACVPVLQSLTINYEPRKASKAGSGGGGDSGNRANSNGGAGSYEYAATSGGSGSGSGGGVGGGTGSGSGQGAGAGRGSGATGGVTGSDVGAAAESDSAAAGSSSGSEMPSQVSTSQADAAAAGQVSGYAMKASGVAGGGEGGGSPVSRGVPAALVAAALVAVVVVVCVAKERHRMQLFAEYDAKTPRPSPAERLRWKPWPRGAPIPAARRRP